MNLSRILPLIVAVGLSWGCAHRPKVEAAREPEDADPTIALPILAVIQAHRAEFDECYARGVARDPTLAGKVVVEFDLASDGSVQITLIREAEGLDLLVQKCLRETMEKLVFSAPRPEGPFLFSYPFVYGHPSMAPRDAGISED